MLWKKLLRTALKYKAQFISMIIMVSIGVGVFIGFNMEWYSLDDNINTFLEETNYADYRIYLDTGFTEDDINKVKHIEGVDAATRFLSLDVSLKKTEANLALTVLEDYTVSTMKIMDGKDYDGKEGIWISDKFAKENKIEIGDSITFTLQGHDFTSSIVGLVKSGEYMICVSGDNQLMPDYRTYGFAYISPNEVLKNLGNIFYPQINLKSNLSKEELEAKLQDALGRTVLLLEKDKHVSYAGAISEIEEGQTMGSILPVLFLAIAVLTMISTMHRITMNEKRQIGILKALGLKNRRIVGHYTSYGFMIGLIGSLIGFSLGYGIAAIVVNPNAMQGTYFDMPYWKLSAPWFCYLAFFATILFLTFISFLSVKRMLRGNAAEVLRPTVPKKVKPFLLEKTKLWNKFSFGTRWNLRDITRHKSRTGMTLIGVIGCMVLLVGALGMKDTMTGFISLIENDIYDYESRINLSSEADKIEIENLMRKCSADAVSTISIDYNTKAISLEIYALDKTNPKIHFVDEKNRSISLSNEGVYLCLRLAGNVSIGDFISFTPYGSDKKYSVKVAGFIRSVVTESIVMTNEYAKSISLESTPTALFSNLTPQGIEALANETSVISSIQTKTSIIESYDNFLEIMNVMVLVLVIAAIILGVVVLYNLGVMSYVERYKELATLKVLGFKNNYIGKLLIGQNLWLSIIGILIGLPLGYLVLKLLLVSLASEYELKLILGPLTYIVSILVTLGVSLLVSFVISIKNKKIDMVESLKM
ncbi:MAG: ABC transporter permease, partial [Anaeroplasma bactoclasticum]|nr:ABC transporter permease [Anaeroplasma bactoclasticum]